MMVCVDALSPALSILGCTVAFTLLSGPSPVGANLLDWVVDRSHFLAWVQDGANATHHDRPVECPVQCHVVLQPPHAAGRLEFHAECALDFQRARDMTQASADDPSGDSIGFP